jgi:hypothetical protein
MKCYVTWWIDTLWSDLLIIPHPSSSLLYCNPCWRILYLWRLLLAHLASSGPLLGHLDSHSSVLEQFWPVLGGSGRVLDGLGGVLEASGCKISKSAPGNNCVRMVLGASCGHRGFQICPKATHFLPSLHKKTLERSLTYFCFASDAKTTSICTQLFPQINTTP